MRKIAIALLLSTLGLQSQAQLINDSLLIEGHYRTFHFFKPSGQGSSIVFAMHGSGGNANQMIKHGAGLEAMARTEDFIMVYPDGYKRFWNECRKAASCAANKENINEQAFFSQMIQYFKTKYKADDTKVFAIGFSGGGHMAYKLALTMPEHFKAVSAIVANMPAEDNMDCGEMKKPVAVMIMNGTADPTNPYKGGMMNTEGVNLGRVRSTDNTVGYWAKLDGYKGAPAKELLADKNPGDNITIEKYSYTDKTKPDVVLYKVINGAHEFPREVDAFVESWEFFKKQMSKNYQ